ILEQHFGETPDQEVIDLYTLTNGHGVDSRITNYGGILVSLKAPDRNGKLADVVLGFDDPEGYLKNNTPYFGAVIGRYGNRIAKGRFSLDGREYRLARNNGEKHLHRGIKGVDRVVCGARAVKRGHAR